MMGPTSGMPSEPIRPGPPVLELVDADLGYRGVSVVHGVSLSVYDGEQVALVGPNGSGKSTLIRAVLGLAEHHQGSVRLFGVPVGQLRDRWRVGYVPQHLTVGSGLPATVREVVSTGRLARTRAWWPLGSAHRAAVTAAVATVGLTDRLDTPVVELSGGQQRRVLIARALAGDPQLLLLDEPTAGVDRANQELLTAALMRLADEGRTLVVVTHELSPFAGLFTRVVRLADGRIDTDTPVTAGAVAGDVSPHQPVEQAGPGGGAQAHPHGQAARTGPDQGRVGLAGPQISHGRQQPHD
jgi:zinc transport system ATP-binding protein